MGELDKYFGKGIFYRSLELDYRETVWEHSDYGAVLLLDVDATLADTLSDFTTFPNHIPEHRVTPNQIKRPGLLITLGSNRPLPWLVDYAKKSGLNPKVLFAEKGAVVGCSKKHFRPQVHPDFQYLSEQIVPIVKEQMKIVLAKNGPQIVGIARFIDSLPGTYTYACYTYNGSISKMLGRNSQQIDDGAQAALKTLESYARDTLSSYKVEGIPIVNEDPESDAEAWMTIWSDIALNIAPNKPVSKSLIVGHLVQDPECGPYQIDVTDRCIIIAEDLSTGWGDDAMNQFGRQVFFVAPANAGDNVYEWARNHENKGRIIISDKSYGQGTLEGIESVLDTIGFTHDVGRDRFIIRNLNN